MSIKLWRQKCTFYKTICKYFIVLLDINLPKIQKYRRLYEKILLQHLIKCVINDTFWDIYFKVAIFNQFIYVLRCSKASLFPTSAFQQTQFSHKSIDIRCLNTECKSLLASLKLPFSINSFTCFAVQKLLYFHHQPFNKFNFLTRQ